MSVRFELHEQSERQECNLLIPETLLADSMCDQHQKAARADFISPASGEIRQESTLTPWVVPIDRGFAWGFISLCELIYVLVPLGFSPFPFLEPPEVAIV